MTGPLLSITAALHLEAPVLRVFKQQLYCATQNLQYYGVSPLETNAGGAGASCGLDSASMIATGISVAKREEFLVNILFVSFSLSPSTIPFGFIRDHILLLSAEDRLQLTTAAFNTLSWHQIHLERMQFLQ
eukprot:Gregarina_sp_Poly_1__1172@NODE_1288_length_4492_cov_416_589831_g871_i0_p3_GENE_NODE_1288_length_4492_cov_416_589831_g871_i0NODE_1288_length_4492_cov_416_589831_g871_i0_p3_ORF_typecomplete_len131_score14_35_NODE_1288_length_4492_cov_416_589831_g871_i011331525